jgi:hypothetical protein
MASGGRDLSSLGNQLLRATSTLEKREVAQYMKTHQDHVAALSTICRSGMLSAAGGARNTKFNRNNSMLPNLPIWFLLDVLPMFPAFSSLAAKDIKGFSKVTAMKGEPPALNKILIFLSVGSSKQSIKDWSKVPANLKALIKSRAEIYDIRRPFDQRSIDTAVVLSSMRRVLTVSSRT